MSLAVESYSDIYYPDSSLPTIQTVKIDFDPDYEKIMMKIYLDSKPTTVNGYWTFNFCGESSKEIIWFLILFIYIFIRGSSGEAIATRLNNDVGGL